jgi:hypothetical protein
MQGAHNTMKSHSETCTACGRNIWGSRFLIVRPVGQAGRSFCGHCASASPQARESTCLLIVHPIRAPVERWLRAQQWEALGGAAGTHTGGTCACGAPIGVAGGPTTAPPPFFLCANCPGAAPLCAACGRRHANLYTVGTHVVLRLPASAFPLLPPPRPAAAPLLPAELYGRGVAALCKAAARKARATRATALPVAPVISDTSSCAAGAQGMSAPSLLRHSCRTAVSAHSESNSSASTRHQPPGNRPQRSPHDRFGAARVVVVTTLITEARQQPPGVCAGAGSAALTALAPAPAALMLFGAARARVARVSFAT